MQRKVESMYYMCAWLMYGRYDNMPKRVTGYTDRPDPVVEKCGKGRKAKKGRK